MSLAATRSSSPRSARAAFLRLADRSRLITKILTGTMLAIMLIDVNASVFFRYYLGSPISWADELAISLMVWVSFLGSSLAVAAGMQYGYDGLVAALPDRVRRPVVVLAQLGVIVLLVLYVVLGIQTLGTMAAQRLPSSGVSMAFIYVSLPIGCALMLVELFAQCLGGGESSDAGPKDII